MPAADGDDPTTLAVAHLHLIEALLRQRNYLGLGRDHWLIDDLRSDAAVAVLKVAPVAAAAPIPRRHFAQAIRRSFRRTLWRQVGKRRRSVLTTAADLGSLVALGVEPPSREPDPAFLAEMADDSDVRTALTRQHNGRRPGTRKRDRAPDSS